MVKEYSGIQSRYEGTNTLRAVFRAALLWFLPYIPAFMWLSIPLNRYDENSSAQNFYIFAWIYHIIYVVITAYCGFLMVGFTIPVPSFKVQLLVLLLVAIITGCFDMIIYHFRVSFIQLYIFAIVFGCFLVFSIFVVHHLWNHVSVKSGMENHPLRWKFVLVSIFSSKPMDVAEHNYLDDNKFLPDFDHMIHSREYYLVQLGRLLMMLLGLLLTYYWCQIFIFLYFRYGTRQLYQVLFSYAFPFSIMAFEALTLFFAEKLDMDTMHNSEYYTALITWIMQLFYLMFYRVLFTSVTTIWTFLLFQLWKLVLDIIIYPIQMSEWGYKVVVIQKQKVLDWILRKKSFEPEVSLELHRFRLNVKFFFVAEGERVSVIAFTIIYIFMLKGWNSDFYTLRTRLNAPFDSVLYFYMYMLLIEWTGSTIITIIIRKFYQVDVLKVGGTLLKNKRFLLSAMFLSTHILQDVILSLNTFDFN